MNILTPLIGDIETTGLIEDIEGLESDLHVMGIAYKSDEGWNVKTTNKKEDVKKVFENPDNTIVGHNFFLFDLIALEKIFKDIKIRATIIDSLLLAWYIEPNRIKEGGKYGLGDFGEEFGVKKPEVESWTGLSYEIYENRVSEDCKINLKVFQKHIQMLRDLYDNDDERIKSLIRFLMTKGAVYKMQYDNPLTLDVEQCKKNHQLFDEMILERVDKLKTVMPKLPISVTRNKPKSLYKKDESLSVAGENWKRLTEGCNLTIDYEGDIKEITGYEEPNPQSPTQVKNWLFSLGWVPEIYIESITKKGTNQVPQLKDKEKNLCNSIIKLSEEVPEIKELTDLSLLQHRRGYFVGFLRDKVRDNQIIADMAGFTNTLRIRHRTLVNLIKPSAPYGEYVRSLLQPPPGMVMIGVDLSALESVTRNNFVYDIDRKFVEDQAHPFYDPHLEICEIAGLMDGAEVFFYKWWKEKRKNPEITFEEIDDNIPEKLHVILETYITDEDRNKFHDKLDKKRQSGKVTNYSSMYGIGAVKLAKDLGITIKEAKKLIEAYWIKNDCVKVFSESCETKIVNNQLWVKNPLNNYYYSLRSQKDIFSTINQGTGDYIFTLWEYNMMKLGVILSANFHDEVVICCKSDDCDIVINKCKQAIQMVNNQLKLKVPVGIDYKIGENYSKVH